MRTGTYSTPRNTLYILLMPVLVAACALGAAMMLARGLVSRERQQLLGRTDAEAKYVAAQLRSAVLQSMDVLPRIGNWWLTQGRPEAREDWETDAQLFLQAGTGLRELVWIDTNGRPLWSVRPGSLPDFNRHSPDTELAGTVRHAQQIGALTLSNVANRKGVPHFYACTPIRSGRLVGFVAGLFDAAALADSLLREQVPRDYEVTIAVDGLRVCGHCARRDFAFQHGGSRDRTGTFCRELRRRPRRSTAGLHGTQMARNETTRSFRGNSGIDGRPPRHGARPG
jgi:sensor domain CHASE-containing protein